MPSAKEKLSVPAYVLDPSAEKGEERYISVFAKSRADAGGMLINAIDPMLAAIKDARGIAATNSDKLPASVHKRLATMERSALKLYDALA